MPIYKINGKLVLFVHVPKAAGTTLHAWLSGAGQTFLFNENKPSYLPCPAQHFHSEILGSLFDFDAFDFKFAVARHPVDRLVSEFFYRHDARPSRRIFPHFIKRTPLSDMSPERLSAYFDSWTRHAFRKYQENNFLLSNHIRPQAEFIDIDGLQVFRLENEFDVLLCQLSDFLGISTNSIRPKNRSVQQKFEIGEATRRLIEDFYEDDFSALSYQVSGAGR